MTPHYLFIRSYRGDLQWLKLSLRTIDKYLTGFTAIFVVCPYEDLMQFQVVFGTDLINLKNIRLMPDQATTRMANDYIGQQNTKLYADTFTGKEGYITYWDSDVALTGPLDAADLFAPADPYKPLYLYTPYEALASDPNAMSWKPITEYWMKEPVAYEFMRRLPLTVKASHLGEIRTWFIQKHGMHLNQALYQVASKNPIGWKQFSEFNLIGAWIHNNHPDDYHWINTVTMPYTNLPIKQYWSWGGLTSKVQQEIAGFLNPNAK